MKKFLTGLAILFSLFSFSQSTTVVISQVYPGGGSSSTTVTYKNDYVELHNISAVTQDISGYSLQYGSATGNFGSSATQIFTFPSSTSIPAGGYLLIQLGAAGTGGANLPVTPDFSSTNLSMGAASGKVALVNTGTGLGCGATATPCNLPSSSIIDLVSYGASNNAEGGVTVNNGVALPANTNGAVRKTSGCTETDNNNNDFDVVVNPVPRNSATPVVICGAPVPILSSTTLSGFGNICINTTGGPNSFTISGTNLTTADVTVASLSGFTYSTTSGGTYTSTLTLTQPGGAFSQQVFVKFDPTAVQSYNGNIVISGGGATSSVNVAATGSGVNTAPSVTTGATSAVTMSSATAAGTITATGCSAVTAYGIEYSTTTGFPNGTGTAVSSSNLAGGNFSSDLTGLATGTTYYYKAYATNSGGTSYGTEQSFTTATPNPTITTTALTSFGNVCINTNAGPNSFTITGSNLTTADITVGPLGGYTFSTTAAGVYSPSLTLTQPGGSYSQEIFVRFTPTALQSYSGNIPVNGGGISTPVNVGTIGNGINSTPSLITGSASAITTTTATLAGNISDIGCSAIAAYGIEYSTTNGFPNGTGTQVASSNLAGGNFTSSLTGLTANTTYYYKAYATNAGGTAYGAQQSFSTAAPPPPVLTASALAGFANYCINTTSGSNSFTLSGTNLTSADVTIGPLTGYSFSTTSNGTFTSTLIVSSASVSAGQTIYVRFTPVNVQSYNGNIPVSGGGATSINVPVTGSGINIGASITTGTATNITTSSAQLGGNITDLGCSNVTAYGIEYSGINGFANGTGISVAGNNLVNGLFSVTVNGLVQGATYYYKAYAVNNAGKVYGNQQTFTVASIPDGFRIFPVPVARGNELFFSMNDLTPGYYGLLFFNSAGELVLQKNINIQANFINQSLTVPGTLAPGIYRVQLVNTTKLLETRSIVIL